MNHLTDILFNYVLIFLLEKKCAKSFLVVYETTSIYDLHQAVKTK